MNPRYFIFPLLGLLTLTGCGEGRSKKKSEQAVPIAAAKVTQQDLPVSLKIVGRAEAFESVVLKSRVDGQVAAVLFTEGQHVKQGEVLIRLDPTDLAARLKQAEATVARDAALVAKAKADTSRYKALREKNFVSEEKLNDIRTNEAAASANLQVSQAAADYARAQLSYTTIRAPFDGIVGARLVFPGSSVKVNDTALAVVNHVRPLLIGFSLPEKHLSKLRAAMRTEKLKVTANLTTDPSQHFEGEVYFIDNAVDTATGTIQMKALLSNKDEKLTPGQFLNITLTIETLKKALTVPSEAIQQGVESNFLYVVKEDDRVEMRKVEAIVTHAGLTAVRTGVSPGEIVVTDGHVRLIPGAKVKISEAISPDNKNGDAGSVAIPPKPEK